MLQSTHLPQVASQPLAPSQQPQLQFHCSLCSLQISANVMYRCAVCSRYELCEVCDGRYGHRHPMMKIKYREYQECRVFAVLREELQGVEGPKGEAKRGRSKSEAMQVIKEPARAVKKALGNIAEGFSGLFGRLSGKPKAGNNAD